MNVKLFETREREFLSILVAFHVFWYYCDRQCLSQGHHRRDQVEICVVGMRSVVWVEGFYRSLVVTCHCNGARVDIVVFAQGGEQEHDTIDP